MTTIEQSPNIYAEVLSRSIYTPKASPRAPLGRFLSQATAASACMTFLSVLVNILLNPTNGYNFVYIFILPVFLAGGMVFGLIEGFSIWGCTRLVKHCLHPAARAGIGVVLCGILLPGYFWIMPLTPYEPRPTVTEWVWSISMSFVFALAVGLVTGSRLQPWPELVRGAPELPPQARILTGITGLLMRVVAVFFVMVAIMGVICTIQTHDRLGDTVNEFIALAHFVAGAVIVFARMKSWLLLPLAVIVNLPSVYFFRLTIKHEDMLLVSMTIGYFVSWIAFLLARFKPTYEALAFLKEELRYYLID
jgi:hypothetical protein